MRASHLLGILEEELNGFITKAKVYHCGRALSRAGVVSGWEDIDEASAAWIIYVAISCPYSRYKMIADWLQKATVVHQLNQSDSPIGAIYTALIIDGFNEYIQEYIFDSAGNLVCRWKNGVVQFLPSTYEFSDKSKQARTVNLLPGAVMSRICNKYRNHQ